MYDFSNTTENESYPICLRAGVIQNVVTTEEVTICYRSNERVRNLYITTGESVEIEIAHPDVRSRWGQFLIKYDGKYKIILINLFSMFLCVEWYMI